MDNAPVNPETPLNLSLQNATPRRHTERWIGVSWLTPGSVELHQPAVRIGRFSTLNRDEAVLERAG